jgi:hypothetical protein
MRNATRQQLYPIARARPIFASDVQRLAGVVTVQRCRSRSDGSQYFQIWHTSKGGDCVWHSPPVADEDRAFAAADILASFVGGVVR